MVDIFFDTHDFALQVIQLLLQLLVVLVLVLDNLATLLARCALLLDGCRMLLVWLLLMWLMLMLLLPPFLSLHEQLLAVSLHRVALLLKFQFAVRGQEGLRFGVITQVVARLAARP